jgi:hypothetical protein
MTKSLEEIIDNPNMLAGKTPAEIEDTIGKTPRWKVERLGKGSHEGEGWVFREHTERSTCPKRRAVAREPIISS